MPKMKKQNVKRVGYVRVQATKQEGLQKLSEDRQSVFEKTCATSQKT